MFSYSESVLHAVEEIQLTVDVLNKEVDLSPENSVINNSLSRLVENLCVWSTQPDMQFLLSLREMQDALNILPKICGLAECEMEKWWANKLLRSSGDIWEAIEQFWYIKQYRQLIASELKLISSLNVNSLAFLGSGSLPLTALLLIKNFPSFSQHLKFICVDNDPAACEFAGFLIEKCNLTDRIDVLNMSAINYVPKKDCLVICASLLKAQNLYQHLYRSGVSNLMVRDVEGIFRFLYSVAPYPSEELYTEVSRTPFCRYRINVSRLFKIR